ncbi:hypothetical protein DEM34_16260 [Spiribacter halobius]|uniref:Polymerase beta nucleotidyltransferase domain-containing protein n=2 Tax=Sediminicurvatus halobius TaxID=2182432 RepID=A0A2U2MX64_9GAMM|nr:hypothetical protein DEM34_16260 [Spiribacter halobius]
MHEMDALCYHQGNSGQQDPLLYMRLSQPEQDAIIDLARKHFGDSAEVWLFGSRVDNERRGGDIDLYVETDRDDILRARAAFKAALARKLGEQQIDLIVRPRQRPPTAFERHVCHQGIRLQ